MQKINWKEYEILKGLNDMWKWIARDSNKSLWAYETKPTRYEHSFGTDPLETDFHPIYGDQFHFVRWEDKEPYNIAELIKGYESSIIIKSTPRTLNSLDFGGEKTEVKKNIEWLKDRVNQTSMYTDRDKEVYGDEWVVSRNKAISFIDQLDEPEVLSQDFIDKYTWNNHYVGRPFVYVDDLQNLLVPKQKEEQKYYVDLGTAAYVARWEGDDQVDIYTDGISGSDEFEFHLTEQEIKDYDERFWTFAVPVEELEE